MKWMAEFLRDTQWIEINFVKDKENDNFYEFVIEKPLFPADKQFNTRGKFSVDEIKTELMNYFASIDQLDIGTSEEEEVIQKSKHSQKLKFGEKRIIWKKILLHDIPRYLLEEKEKNLLHMVLLTRFLYSAHILADPVHGFGISSTDIINYKLKCHIYRLYIFSQLIENQEIIDEYKELHKTLLLAYHVEFERFINFVSSTDFKLYILDDKYVQRISQRVYKLIDDEEVQAVSEIKNIEIDNVIHGFVKQFICIRTKYSHFIVDNEGFIDDEKFKKLISKLVSTFYLPRFSLKEARSFNQFLSNKEDNINLGAPRLLASILIGAIPILLTDEINQWALERLSFFNDSGLNLWGIVLTPTIIALSWIFCWKYIGIEVNNVLGYQNQFSRKRHRHIFFRGLCYSAGVCLVGHICFTGKFINKDEYTGLLPYLDPAPIFIELLFVQIFLSFVLSLILQTIWEDKPITQPL